MVNTKTGVKIFIKKYVEKTEDPFTTYELQDKIKKAGSTNVYLAPNRLTQYIKATGQVTFNKKKEHWEKKQCHENQEKNTTPTCETTTEQEQNRKKKISTQPKQYST